MTEDQIERIAENRMDALDRDYLKGRLDSETYDKKVAELDEWVKSEIRRNSLALSRMEA